MEGFGALSKRRRGSSLPPESARERPGPASGYVRTILAAAAVADGANICAAQREEEHVRVEMHRRSQPLPVQHRPQYFGEQPWWLKIGLSFIVHCTY